MDDSDPSNGNQHWKVTQLPNGNYVFTCQANGYNMGFPDAGLVGEPIFQLNPMPVRKGNNGYW